MLKLNRQQIMFCLFTLFVNQDFSNAESQVSAGVDVNDVSFLFPLKNGLPLPRLNLASENLISQKILEQVLLFENPGRTLEELPYLDSSFLKRRENWYITSLRIDSCGDVFNFEAKVDPVNSQLMSWVRKSPGCQGRIRLVAQPFNDFLQPLPSAIHLLYNLSAEEADGFVTELISLKTMAREIYHIDTSGVPLVVHPVLSFETQKTQRPIANRFREVILEYLRAAQKEPSERLNVVTINVQSKFNHWRLAGGHVEHGKWTRFVTEFSKIFNKADDPTVLTGVEVLSCDLNPICTMSPSQSLDPALVSGTFLTYIFQDDVSLKQLQVPGFRDDKIQRLAEVVDDPSQVHFFNTNCTSCHQSANLRDYQGFHSNFSPAKNITPFVPQKYLNQQVNTVINFGYQGLQVRISTRTAAESGHVAELINSKRGLVGPSPERDLRVFWQCLTTEVEFKKCL